MNPLSPKTIGVFASSLLFVAAAILGLDAPASAEPPDKTTAKSKAPPPVKAQQEEAQKPQFAPLVEAQKNGVKTCLPMLGESRASRSPGRIRACRAGAARRPA